MKNKRMNVVTICAAVATVFLMFAANGEVCGAGTNTPSGYVPALLSNGNLCMTVDFSGGVSAPKKERKRGMSNGIFIMNRRLEGPKYALYGHGWYRPTLKVDGKEYRDADRWRQTLDPVGAKTIVVGEFDDVKRTIETFVAHDSDVIAVRQTFSGAEGKRIEAGIEYFAPEGDRITGEWAESADARVFTYTVCGKNVDKGTITVRNSREGDAFVTFISFGKPYTGAYAALKERHTSAWAKYYNASEIDIPDPEVTALRRMAEYQLKCNTTKWSIPVGILPSHFQGGVFAFDEMYAVQGLLSAGHFREARRASDYRFATLGIAKKRVAGTGARWVWTSIEDPKVEWAPIGYWMDHIFHMSAIARTCHLNATYSGDVEYLRKKAYPVIRECARFFANHCVYDAPDGSSFVCKCTDLERLGTAHIRPFMTTCGVIDTLRLAVRAAQRLGVDAKNVKTWSEMAKRLEKSLPVNNGRFAAAANRLNSVSMGVLAGYFPFPIFPKGHKEQTAAVDWFLSHGVKAGNMYATGKNICPWYAATMAMAAMRSGKGEKAHGLIKEAGKSSGVWGEYWEINESGVAECRPWFMTAAGNCLYAINSMFLMEADGECRIGAGVPKEWKNWSFRLPCESACEVECKVSNGKVTKLVLRPRRIDPARRIRIVLPDGSRIEVVLDKAEIMVHELPAAVLDDTAATSPAEAPRAKFKDGMLSSTRPVGWLARALKIQADGLTGHPEALSYPYDSCLWAGEIPRKGKHGKQWWRYEQTAYYTDGLLRLGYALGDKTFVGKGEAGIDYTLEHASAEGQLGNPALWDATRRDVSPKQILWPMTVFFRAMKAKFDATHDARIPAALAKYYLLYDAGTIASGRNTLAIEGMLWTYGMTGDRRLLDLAQQAWRMKDDADCLTPEKCADGRPIWMHGVTYSEGLKIPMLLFEHTGRDEYLRQAVNAEEKLVRDHLLPDGAPSSTEHTRGNSVYWGHETCDIADYTWSLGYFLEIAGDAKYADRIERCVFNAGFGCVSDDFRALQYFSNMNQFICTSDSDHNPFKRGKTWMQYRPTHETECCAGNVQRILPNYVSRMWLKDAKGAPVAALYGPCEVDFGWAKITEETCYPFDGKIAFRFFMKEPKRSAFTYRVPGWCRSAAVKVNGKSVAAGAPGMFASIERIFADGDMIELDFPMDPVFETVPPRFVVSGKHPRGKRPADAFAHESQGTVVTRGPLVFAYPIPAERTQDNEKHANMNGKKSANPDFKCWNLRPAGAFNYALAEHRAEVVDGEAGDGFFKNPAAVKLRVPVHRIEWELDKGRFTPDVPENPVVLDGPEEMVDLIPYGATMLRLSVFPDNTKMTENRL